MNKVEEFLSEYTIQSTNRSYRVCLNRFFGAINADPNTYFEDNRDYEQDVKTLHAKLKKEKKPALSQKQTLMVVKTFLENYDVLIPKRKWKKTRKKIKGSRAATLDAAPTKKELKQILTHANAMKKSLFLIACSSGIRISTILQLEPSDVDLECNPPKITIPSNITKTGNPRYCFMSNEAKAALIEYLKIRDDYLQSAINRSKNKPHIKRNPNEDRKSVV